MLDREAIWRLICQEVDRLDDGTGNPVDLGIHRLVVALRAHGCPTFQSCQGHFRWGSAQPWCDIRLPGALPVGQTDENSYSVVRPLELRIRLALVRVLDAFYENRARVPHHARLAVDGWHNAPGWIGISTVAHQAGFELHGEERWTWLRQGLHEAQSFASFLRREFLRNGPTVGPEPIIVTRSL